MTKSPESSTFDADENGAALNDLADTIKRAYASGDAELYASAFADDAIVSMPNQAPLCGRDAIKSAFETKPPLPAGATFDVDPTELEIISPEWAYAFGTDTLSVPIPGSEPRIETMTFMVLIRKTPEGWKTFREVLSADQGATTMNIS
jgi:uncharacterized protein (TIGR02246 family)